MRSFLAPFSAFGKHRFLTYELTRRDVQGRYRGASFGIFWSLLSPFLMLLVYTLAFGYILRSQWPGSTGSTSDFALILFVGLIVHGLFAECLSRSPGLIVGNANYVKRIVFPLHVLVWSVVLSALFHTTTNTLVFAALHLVVHGYIHPTILLLPLVLLPLVLVTVGVSWMMSAAGVYIRDLGQVTGVLSTALLFLSSAIIPLQSLPERYKLIFKLNPLTFIIDQAREVAIWGRMPDWAGLGKYMLGAMLVAWIGYALFNKASRGFADVL